MCDCAIKTPIRNKMYIYLCRKKKNSQTSAWVFPSCRNCKGGKTWTRCDPPHHECDDQVLLLMFTLKIRRLFSENLRHTPEIVKRMKSTAHRRDLLASKVKTFFKCPRNPNPRVSLKRLIGGNAFLVTIQLFAYFRYL